MAELSDWVAAHPALFTDQYELTMAASYFAERMTAPATFSFFVRRHPPGRGYLVAAGIDDVLDYLEALRFTAADLAYLRSTGLYAEEFLAFLGSLRFSGEVDALDEGALCFADEPLLEVTAPIIEAQLVETYCINRLNLQTMLATKAARCIGAAGGRAVVDFSLRRAQGTDAGMQIARCSYLVGAAGTSNLLAGLRWGIPTFGTMAHSYVESFDDEAAAFRAFARVFPQTSTFLVDTYDTLGGVRAAIPVARALRAAGHPAGVRLDSGDLAALSRGARRLLDEAGLTDVRIFASGGLDEYQVAALIEGGAPIDAFGVGTSMGVSGDAPWLDCAYKLVEYAGRGRLKLSEGKKTWIGRKQVWRRTDGERVVGDCLALRDEPADAVAAAFGCAGPALTPLLRPVMRGGKRLAPAAPLAARREAFARAFAQLDAAHKRLRDPAPYPVAVSPGLLAAQAAAEAAARTRVRSTTGAPA
jgi:nicotinate phosphoribosyltransferase